MNELHLKKLTENDIPVLTKIMTDAFNVDSMMHLHKDGGPDGYNDGSFLKKWGLHPYATSYCVMDDDRIIGAFILWIHQNKKHNLGCIFVDPTYQNQGVGLRIWNKIESLYPDAISWETETPIFSHRNHNFYVNKCGFHIVRIEDPKNWSEGMFILRKEMKNN